MLYAYFLLLSIENKFSMEVSKGESKAILNYFDNMDSYRNNIRKVLFMLVFGNEVFRHRLWDKKDRNSNF